jgi:hypothetical protein
MTSTLTDDQYNELVRLLVGDIETLVPLIFPQGRAVSDSHIRLTSGILRRWLVDGDLQKVLAPLRQSALFSVEGNSLAKAYGDRTNAFRYYLTGGVMANGQSIRHIYDSPLDPGCIDRSFINEGRIRLPLKKFLAQPRLFYDGNWFNTGQILRFVANKLGGNHIDFDRVGEWERLDAANAFMRYGGPILKAKPDGCEVYLILEPQSDEIIGGVHLEVIAAAAAFVQMEIDGVQLCTLRSERSLRDRLRRLFRRPAAIRMID